MRLRWALAGVSAAVVVALASFSSPIPGIPLILVRQGVSLHVIGGQEVFIARQGSIVHAFPRTVEAVGGEGIVYCPNEEAFVAPMDTSLWTVRGEWVAGSANANLPEHPTRVDNDLVLHVNVRKIVETGRTPGEISGEAGDRYARFRAGDGFVRFCQGPIPAIPGAVPTPSP